MLFYFLLAGSVITLFATRRYHYGLPESWNDQLVLSDRELTFENPYFPVESDAWDHAWRHVQQGYSVGNTIGKMEYANPLPYVVNNEFIDSMNETGEGFAVEKGPDFLSRRGGAVDVPGQVALIEDWFGKQEHPRIDISRQDITKGRHRRRQWSFVPSD